MVNLENLKEFMKTENYNLVLENIAKKLNRKMEDGIPSYAMLIYNDKALKIAKLDIMEIKKVITEDSENFSKYTIEKIKFFTDTKEEFEEEYPEGEEPDEDEKPVLIETRPAPRSFLIGPSIEYWLLKNNFKYLEIYLKLIRMPQAKKYAKQLKKIYDEAVQ